VVREGGDAKPLPGQPLRELGRQRGIAMGTAVRSQKIKGNRAYRQLIAAQFSSVTPENEMKWGVVEAKRGELRFKGADEIVDRALEASQIVRGHTLVWFSQLPPWVSELDGDQLRAAVTGFMREMIGRYRGRVGVWDVVNEAITDGGALRPFISKLGKDFIAEAFRIAHDADPKAKLFINEIGADGINDKSNQLYEIVRELKAQGVPIDGVGLQVHANLKGVPDSFADNMRRFAALGLELAITEADVGLKLPVGAKDLEAQADVYAGMVRDCLAVKACRSLTFWGFTDSRSWIPETQPGMGAATLLDEKLEPKPAFLAVQRALAP